MSRPSVTWKVTSVLKLQSSNLAIKFLILMPNKLPTRFLIFCLEAELFDVKDDKNLNIFGAHLFFCLLDDKKQNIF